MHSFYKNPAEGMQFLLARLSVICIDHAALNVNDAFEDAVKKETNDRHARNSRKMLRAYVSTFSHSGESNLKKRKERKKIAFNVHAVYAFIINCARLNVPLVSVT